MRLHRPAAIGTPKINLAIGQFWPWAVLALLVLLCAVDGLSTVHGLAQPGDVDSLRDVGSIQGFLDGNWFGDPVYAGEWRWYPPLLPALGAIGTALTGASPLVFWVQAGPWLNLLTPITFFLMSRALLGSPACAAAATSIYVFVNSTLSLPWITGGYTPWPFVASISQAFFFLTVALIRARVGPAMRRRHAALIGAAIGLTFLAHALPAVILTAIITAAILSTLGFQPRSIGLLACVAALELAFMTPYLAPVLAHYPHGILNTAPGQYVEEILSPENYSKLPRLYAPGLVCALSVWLLRRRAPLSGVTLSIVTTWICVSAILLIQRLACAAHDGEPAVCRVLAVPAHHYYFYLQTAWACLAGHVVWQAARGWLRVGDQISRRRIAVAIGACAVLAGGGSQSLLRKSYDERARGVALRDNDIIDRVAYGWIREHTRPTDLFITPLVSDWQDPAAFSVISAGRRLIAAPELHSNPFVDWHERDALRRRYLAAATGAGPERDLCGLATQRAWLLLPNETAIASTGAQPAYRTAYNSIYRISDTGCDNPD